MPAFSHGKLAKISTDNAAGALVDISNVVNSVDLPLTQDTAETSAFGTTAKTYVAGQNDSTVSIAGLFDPTFDAQISAVIAGQANGTIASSTVDYNPQGTTSGKVKYVLEVLWTSYSTSAGVGDVVNFKLEGQRTGDTVRSTNP